MKTLLFVLALAAGFATAPIHAADTRPCVTVELPSALGEKDPNIARVAAATRSVMIVQHILGGEVVSTEFSFGDRLRHNRGVTRSVDLYKVAKEVEVKYLDAKGAVLAYGTTGSWYDFDQPFVFRYTDCHYCPMGSRVVGVIPAKPRPKKSR